jgi:hypothetical protein
MYVLCGPAPSDSAGIRVGPGWALVRVDPVPVVVGPGGPVRHGSGGEAAVTAATPDPDCDWPDSDDCILIMIRQSKPDSDAPGKQVRLDSAPGLNEGP